MGFDRRSSLANLDPRVCDLGERPRGRIKFIATVVSYAAAPNGAGASNRPSESECDRWIRAVAFFMRWRVDPAGAIRKRSVATALWAAIAAWLADTTTNRPRAVTDAIANRSTAAEALQNSQQSGRAPLRRTKNPYRHNSAKTTTSKRPVTFITCRERCGRLVEKRDAQRFAANGTRSKRVSSPDRRQKRFLFSKLSHR
jgi:hypothetical protein